MSKSSTVPSSIETTTSLGYVRPPTDACEEAAHRLNVVIKMLTDHDCPAGSPSPDADPADDDGGYDLSIARDVLRDIRNMLQASVPGRGLRRCAMSRPDATTVTCKIADLRGVAHQLRTLAAHLDRLSPFDGDLPKSSQLEYITRPRSFRDAFANRDKNRRKAGGR